MSEDIRVYNSRFDVRGRGGSRYSFRRLATSILDIGPSFDIWKREQSMFCEFKPTGMNLEPDLVEFLRRLAVVQSIRLPSGQRAPSLDYEDLAECYANVAKAGQLLLNCFSVKELFREVLKRRGHGYIAGTTSVLPG